MDWKTKTGVWGFAPQRQWYWWPRTETVKGLFWEVRWFCFTLAWVSNKLRESFDRAERDLKEGRIVTLDELKNVNG